MASEMVERVARAIDPAAFVNLYTGNLPVDEAARIEERQIVARQRAREAIAAMRNLTDDIVSFGEAVAVEAGIQRAYQLMIERALKDEP